MKLIVPLLIYTLVVPVWAFGDAPPNVPPPVETETKKPKIASLIEGQIAPFTGTLFNDVATAELIAEREFALKECELRIKHAVDKEKARCSLLLDTSNTSIESLQSRYNTILDLKDKEIDRLSKIAIEGSNDYSHWWATGGFVIGTALTIAVFFVATEMNE
tara:strand:- start:70 stop:552 length:483 start_codon:yes stop_codon:yes gene_type:complete